MIATAIPYASSPLKASDTDQGAELTLGAMADFTFTIVVPLASPIQPVATLNMTRKTGHRLHPTPPTSSEPAAFANLR
jgi:hypothetical protein